MEIANLIVRILETIAWPFTIIIIILIFKGKISRAILNLSKLRFKGLEVEFDKDLKDAEYKARELQLPSPEDIRTIQEPIVPTSPFDRLFQIAEISPRAAITEAWRIIEFSMMEAARAHGVEIRRLMVGREVIQNLAQRGKLLEGTLNLYEALRKIRNKAAHAHEVEIDFEEAVRYIDLALSLAHRFQILINEP